jgi:hypothetical protein
MKLISDIEQELISLGFREKQLHELPDVIIRISILINLAHLFYNDNHQLELTDKKWLQYYSHYVHFFDCDKYEQLGSLVYDLINHLSEDIGFSPTATTKKDA